MTVPRWLIPDKGWNLVPLLALSEIYEPFTAKIGCPCPWEFYIVPARSCHLIPGLICGLLTLFCPDFVSVLSRSVDARRISRRTKITWPQMTFKFKSSYLFNSLVITSCWVAIIWYLIWNFKNVQFILLWKFLKKKFFLNFLGQSFSIETFWLENFVAMKHFFRAYSIWFLIMI